jgi:hypothetical protein
MRPPMVHRLLGLLAIALAMSLPLSIGGSQQAAAPVAAPAQPDSAAAAPRSSVNLMREVFTYQRAGRRDPFVSLATTSDLRPLITDLTLVGILADPSGQRSVAVLRDKTDRNKQYRVTVGSTLGRLRVTRITSRDVTFSIEEFGRNRQEVLTYGADSTRARP